MKKAITPLFITLLFSAAVFSKDTVKVAVFDYIPLCSNDHSNQPGLFISLLEYIAEKEDWHLKYVTGALNDSKRNLAESKVDIMVAAQFSNDSVPYVFTRETVVSTWAMMYTRKENRQIENVLDIEGMRVGVVRDDPHNDALRKTVKRLNRNCLFVEFKHPHDLIAALDRKWIDVGLVDRLYWFNNKKFSDIKKVSAVLSPIEFRFAVAKNRGNDIGATLDYYIHTLKSDPQSIYYKIVGETFSEKKQFVLPLWIYLIGYLVGVLILLGIGMLFLLQRQVRRKTAELTRKNIELEKEIIMRRVSEKRYRELYESSRDGFLVIDTEYHILECNSSFCDMLGYSVKELVNLKLTDLIVECYHEAEKCVLQKEVMKRGYSDIYESEYIRKDGQSLNVEIRANLLHDEHNKPRGIWAFVRDITENQVRLNKSKQQQTPVQPVTRVAPR